MVRIILTQRVCLERSSDRVTYYNLLFVRYLVDALQKNESMTTFDLERNVGISNQGQLMLLKLSFKSHLDELFVKDVDPDELLNVDGEVQRQTENILEIRGTQRQPEAADREKVFRHSFIAREEQSWLTCRVLIIRCIVRLILSAYQKYLHW